MSISELQAPERPSIQLNIQFTLHLVLDSGPTTASPGRHPAEANVYGRRVHFNLKPQYSHYCTAQGGHWKPIKELTMNGFWSRFVV